MCIMIVCLCLQGEKFVQLLERQSLQTFLGQVAATHPGCTLSLCLEGLHSHLRHASCIERFQRPELAFSACLV